MSTQLPFTIEQFYKFIKQGKLMAGKCLQCGKIHLPPRPVCDNCYSERFEWREAPKSGQLLTYTVIHLAPTQFQPLTPYAVGIVELEHGFRLPGMIEGASQNQLKIGMTLAIDLGACNTTQPWPQWPKYFFKPA